MKRIYLIGDEKNKISLSVKVGTVGVAYSSVNLKRSGGLSEFLKESGTDSGSVSKTLIGVGKDIKNSVVVVVTVIDFSGFSSTERKNHITNISANYTISGGLPGQQKFNFDSDDIIQTSKNRYAIISKAIKLK